ncbi:hypothetical protein D3C79_943010 [compost metagenome]
MRQPPEKARTGLCSCSLEKPRPCSRLAARERMVQASMASSLPCSVAMAWPSFFSFANCNSASSWRNSRSPSITYSMAGTSSAGVSWLTQASAQLVGKV